MNLIKKCILPSVTVVQVSIVALLGSLYDTITTLDTASADRRTNPSRLNSTASAASVSRNVVTVFALFNALKSSITAERLLISRRSDNKPSVGLYLNVTNDSFIVVSVVTTNLKGEIPVFKLEHTPGGVPISATAEV